MNTYTFQIETENRVGITHDVIECVQYHQIDIIRMEVKPHYIFLKIPFIKLDLQEQVYKSIRQIAGVRCVDLIPFLPSEVKKDQLQTILGTISEGVILVNMELQVQSINRAAIRLLQLPCEQWQGEEIPYLLGFQREEWLRILKEGREVINMPITIRRAKSKPIRLIASFFPICPKPKSQTGVVIVLRDWKQVNELIQSVKQSGVIQFEDIIYCSSEMRQCVGIAKRVASSEATIYLHGESGTGKELFARAIHFDSLRANGPFVAINCATIPDQLLESEWFGYEEGAFTGAVKGGKIGLFEVAQGGTIFLDEIGEIPIHLQAKLLRVIEERTIRRIGSSCTIPLQVRFITATNRDLVKMVDEGLFREDLYYRLHVIPISIPPLRDRISDLPLLATHFVNQICDRMGRSPMKISPEVIQTLCSYQWPGNVRELQNVIERSIYLCEVAGEEWKEVSLPHQKVLPLSNTLGLKDKIAIYEQELIKEALQGNRSVRQAALSLQLSHTALLKKMKKYDLQI